MKARGLTIDPNLATGDGALGCWKALDQVYPSTRVRRCWVHKTANVLDNLPKWIQPRAKGAIRQIWMAETRKEAQDAFDRFLKAYQAKSPKVCEYLCQDRAELLGFYDFSAEHRKHLRTTNPIESTFATIRLRHRRTKGSGSRTACLAMVFKLTQSVAKRWRLLNVSQLLQDVIQGVQFFNGIKTQQGTLPDIPRPNSSILGRFLEGAGACAESFTVVQNYLDIAVRLLMIGGASV